MHSWLRHVLGRHAGQSIAKSASADDVPPALPPGVSASALCKERGNALLGQGKLQEACVCYEEAIRLAPDDASAYINLGFALIEQQAHLRARAALTKAAVLDPTSVDACYLLGCSARALNDRQGAIAHFRQALALKPDFMVACGDLCRTLVDDGQYDAAKQIIVARIAQDPANAELHFFLGNIHASTSAPDLAIAAYHAAVALQPAYAQAHNNLGLAFHANKDLAQAVASFGHALAIKPDLAEAHANLGLALNAQGRFAQAVQSFEKALALQPVYPMAHNHLGNALRALGRLEASRESFRRAIELDPADASAHCNLGNLLCEQGRTQAAIACYHRALGLNAKDARIHNNLGNALREFGELEAAMASCRQAVALDSAFGDAYISLGIVLLDCGQLAAAVESFRHACALMPDRLVAMEQLLFALSFGHDCTPQQYHAQALEYGERLRAQASAYTHWPASNNEGSPRTLRIGLVSGDLRQHPVGFFLESVIAHLDPHRIDLRAYTTTCVEGDALSARLQSYFSGWTNLHGMSDDAAAARIRADGIDILIDLAGHTAHHRLPVFARKPAPVQVSWLGYWASTGVPGMDFLLADRSSVPDEDAGSFTETIWYLPDTRFCFTAPHADLPVMCLPAERNGCITFGSFQNAAKINDDVIRVWGRIFAAMPLARLHVQSKQMRDPFAIADMQRRLQAVGIAADRVRLCGPGARDDYLAAYGDVDIVLDTFPYPGGTTTCEALWAGVPTITMAGATLLSRQGASLLTCARLADWIAEDHDAYVRLALAHATDQTALAALRSRLREQVMASPLFDAPRFARNLEDALHAMWRKRRSMPVGASQS